MKWLYLISFWKLCSQRGLTYHFDFIKNRPLGVRSEKDNSNLHSVMYSVHALIFCSRQFCCRIWYFIFVFNTFSRYCFYGLMSEPIEINFGLNFIIIVVIIFGTVRFLWCICMYIRTYKNIIFFKDHQNAPSRRGGTCSHFQPSTHLFISHIYLT